jgi:hypothetical protein
MSLTSAVGTPLVVLSLEPAFGGCLTQGQGSVI